MNPLRDRFQGIVTACLVGAILLTWAGLASAGTGVANITWTNPTAYADTSPLAAVDIAETQVYCDFTPTGGTAAACNGTPAAYAGSVTTGAYTFTYPAVGGVACFYLRTRVGTLTSDPSSPKACKNFAAVKPGSPTVVTVTVTISAP